MLAPVGGAPRRPRGPDHARPRYVRSKSGVKPRPRRGRPLVALRRPINRAGHSLIMDDEPPVFSNAGRRPRAPSNLTNPRPGWSSNAASGRLLATTYGHLCAALHAPVFDAGRMQLRERWRRMRSLCARWVFVWDEPGIHMDACPRMHALVHGTCPPSRPSERLTVEFGSARTHRFPEPAIACSPCHRLSRG